jgi:hypothetical protein
MGGQGDDGGNRRVLRLIYNAQTSDGLFISVPAAKTSALQRHGTLVTVVIGEVMEKKDVSLIVRG